MALLIALLQQINSFVLRSKLNNFAEKAMHCYHFTTNNLESTLFDPQRFEIPRIGPLKINL